MSSYPLTGPAPTGPAVLRAGVLAIRGERDLIVVDPRGTRRLVADLALQHHALSADGRYLVARGDDGRRAQIWSVATGERLLDLTGATTRREAMRASVAELAGEPLAFVFDRSQPNLLALRSLVDGSRRGWWSTAGFIGWDVEAVLELGPGWLAALGHADGEQYDTVVVVAAAGALDDDGALQHALLDQPGLKAWGYQVAIGPAGAGHAVTYRNPEWDDDDRPDDPGEALCGFAILDLAARAVVQRIAHDLPVANAAALGADHARIVVEIAGGVRLIDRATGGSDEHAALAFDPYRLEVARLAGDRIALDRL